jgi:DNA helicase-2/ATP-dependent DNA helicase PcrA
MAKLREEKVAAERYPEAIARLEGLLEQAPDESVETALVRFLERVALSVSEGAEAVAHRVNLLTLHSTKGLEFRRVYIVGVEDEQMPGWIRPDEPRDHAIEEARRLLYVGMTRAEQRLVLTRVDRRSGKPGGASQFLEEMRLDVERPSF